MRTETIIIGGQAFTVRELPTRKNSAFRAKVAESFSPLATALESGPRFLAKFDGMNTELNGAFASTLLELMQSAGGILLKSPDMLRSLVYEYAPEIAAQAEAIEDEAYDSEYLKAFTQILGLAYPFGSLATMLQQTIAST